MNRKMSGTVISWRTRNIRKLRRAEIWCADYGLKQVHKALHVGTLYENERRALERKLKHLLNAKNDWYCILVFCAGCLSGVRAAHEIKEIKSQYEIV